MLHRSYNTVDRGAFAPLAGRLTTLTLDTDGESLPGAGLAISLHLASSLKHLTLRVGGCAQLVTCSGQTCVCHCRQ